ncbi:MauE/DoxX family redox-associated membrane protein [Pedobacter sp. ASV28]|uniref:MauE/DoxX family redox-associated membrane protein n=1 Tax=Pedobacter sp. ASV28 TaxID=2795123 RepID=UPI0018EAA308|nr:MauE/DoxX family redox-associated membrane protein [Pedobacter sp. ASV28]
MRIRNIFIGVISILFIVLWVYAGLSKLTDYGTFKFQLGRSPYLQNLAGPIAITLPIAELATAVLLIFDRTRLLGLYLSFFAMLMFTGYIYAMLYHSYFVPCSCGGILSQLSWQQHLVFNIVFTLLALFGIVLYILNGRLNRGRPLLHQTAAHMARQ